MMKKSNWLLLTIILGVVVMLLAFLVVPAKYPWYYEVLFFNVGLWPWLIAKKELKKMKLQSSQNSQ